jgi:hypothetical protein
VVRSSARRMRGFRSRSQRWGIASKAPTDTHYMYLRTMHFRTTIPDLILESRWPGTTARPPVNPPPALVHLGPHGPGLSDRGRTHTGGWKDLPMSISKEHVLLRFQGVVIASQLPDNAAEALLVLDYARQMVVDSLHSSGVSDHVQRVSIQTQPAATPLAHASLTVQ